MVEGCKARTFAVLIVLLLAGCATMGGDAPARPMTADELRRHCLGQMYADRAARGRSAVNWHIYDYCMKRHS